MSRCRLKEWYNIVVRPDLDKLLTEHDGIAICVAHRLTTIKNCNNIVLMHEGKTVEQGTHEELLKIQVKRDDDKNPTQGFYHALWDTQMGEESFGSPEHMNEEQLSGKKKYLKAELQKIRDEKSKRVSTGAVLAG